MVRAESGAARVRMWMPRDARGRRAARRWSEFESPTEAPPTLEEETRVVMEMVNRADRVKAAADSMTRRRFFATCWRDSHIIGSRRLPRIDSGDGIGTGTIAAKRSTRSE